MDNGALVTSSAGYTKEALWGQWTRWLIFIICGLPMAFLPFLLDPKKLMDGATFRWDLVPWTEIAIIFIAGILLSFILSGYLVRIYRGATIPPEFDSWGSLYVDGIKIAITGFLWFLPIILILAALLAIIFAGFANGSPLPAMVAIVLAVILIIAEIATCVIVLLYSMMGIVRCARTGSIREGLRFTAITETLRAIGWVNYIVALIVLFVIAFVFFMVLSIFSLNQYAGAIASIIFTPLYTVFAARYITQVYDAGAAPQPAA